MVSLKLEPQRTRRALSRVFAAGMALSLGVSAVFYALLSATHPPAAITPGSSSGAAIQAWIAAYSNWQNTSTTYSNIYGIGLVAAIELAVALVVLYFPRPSLYAAFALMNVYFAWTSHVMSSISEPAEVAFGQVLMVQDNFFWTRGGLAYFAPSAIFVADTEALLLLAAVVLLTFALNFGKGKARATLLGLQAGGLSLTILGTEIALFDHNEFFLHVTQAQALMDFLPSFTNADLLVVGVAVLAASTYVLRLRGGAFLARDRPL